MTVKGVDAYGAIPVAHLSGYDFVGRYVAQEPGKCATPAEVAGYHKAGKSVVLFYEDEAEDGLGGANMGTAKARLALPILEAIGWPKDRPVHFACDFSPVGTQINDCLAAAKSFALGIDRPVGIYGDVNVCTAGHQAGIQYLIQFGIGRAPGITVYQGYPEVVLDGQPCDPDEALAADYGQWAPPPPPKPPKPKLARTLEGKANLLGRCVWNTTLKWSQYDHLTVSGGGSKTTANAINAGGNVRIRVARATRGSTVTVRLYAKTT